MKLALIPLLLVGLSWAQGASEKPCAVEELEQITLNGLYDKLIENNISTANSGECGKSLELEQAQIACLRDWVKKQSDHCVREAYSSWLDFYQHNLKDAREECATHADHAKEAAVRRRASKYAAAHKVPTPPAGCERPKKAE